MCSSVSLLRHCLLPSQAAVLSTRSTQVRTFLTLSHSISRVSITRRKHSPEGLYGVPRYLSNCQSRASPNRSIPKQVHLGEHEEAGGSSQGPAASPGSSFGGFGGGGSFTTGSSMLDAALSTVFGLGMGEYAFLLRPVQATSALETF